MNYSVIRFNIGKARTMDYEMDFHETPFDPELGLIVKHDRYFSNKELQIRALEESLQFRFPPDFLELIGDYCSIGYDGDYVIKIADGELTLSNILTIRHPDEHDMFSDSIPQILDQYRGSLLGSSSTPRYIPFADAHISNAEGHNAGWLAFQRTGNPEIVYVPGRTVSNPFSPGEVFKATLNVEPFFVASSVAEMMSHAVYRHYG